ncbi:MAG TPA: hypothetical protein VJT50_04500 [Pyrinomonadaceae bacterium]|nr:hypothetical protein [Pyrinomonadaceae bacterium]
MAEPGAQAFDETTVLASLDRRFARLHFLLIQTIQNTPDRQLYRHNPESSRSVAESVLRAAAAVEQTFGGISANLWDDPFEWTLPEQLTTGAAIIAHLSEVEAMRQRVFASITADSLLQKQVATPTGISRLGELLDQTLSRALQYHEQAQLGLEMPFR